MPGGLAGRCSGAGSLACTEGASARLRCEADAMHDTALNQRPRSHSRPQILGMIWTFDLQVMNQIADFWFTPVIWGPRP